MSEAADLALRKCQDLAKPAIWEKLKAERQTIDPQSGACMLNKSSEVIYILYALYMQLALYMILRGRLTAIDCTLDLGGWFRFQLARQLYFAFENDVRLAALHPKLEYNPVVSGWREKRLERPEIHWWRGLSPGRLDRAVRLFIEGQDRNERVITFGEFEDLYLKTYDSDNRSLQKLFGIAANPL